MLCVIAVSATTRSYILVSLQNLEMTNLKHKKWFSHQNIALAIRIANRIHNLMEIVSTPELNIAALATVLLMLIADLIKAWRNYSKSRKNKM